MKAVRYLKNIQAEMERQAVREQSSTLARFAADLEVNLNILIRELAHALHEKYQAENPVMVFEIANDN